MTFARCTGFCVCERSRAFAFMNSLLNLCLLVVSFVDGFCVKFFLCVFVCLFVCCCFYFLLA